MSAAKMVYQALVRSKELTHLLAQGRIRLSSTPSFRMFQHYRQTARNWNGESRCVSIF